MSLDLPPARRFPRAVLWLVLLLLAPRALAGQAPRVRPETRPAFYWGVNVGTAALSSWLQGLPHRVAPVRALAGGLAGGTAMYAGQRLVGSGRPGLRFAGLQTVALGASVARNLGQGRGALSELTFPVFPFYLQVRPGASPHASLRLSAVGLAGLLSTASQPGVSPDWGASLVAGTPVFVARAERLSGCEAYSLRLSCSEVVGHHVLGGIVYTTAAQDYSPRNVLTHELGHVAEDVRDVVLHAVPASDAALRTTGVGRFLARFIVVDGFLPLDMISHAAGPPARDAACQRLHSFYECETEAMMRDVH